MTAARGHRERPYTRVAPPGRAPGSRGSFKVRVAEPGGPVPKGHETENDGGPEIARMLDGDGRFGDRR